ncbi:MAG TPA: hypothetical protein VJT85_11810, partial [Gemmatimonadaceae bacterium]|nr:hypothetical protein [Gemmatimonadaceae bacterium]
HFDFIYYKDIVSYLSAGEKLARGELAGVNSYWQPLLSMELAVFIRLGFSPERAVDVVKILNGLIALQCARTLVRALGTTGWLAAVLDAVLVVVALYCALPFMSADLLISGILCFYFAIVLRQDYPARRRAGLMAGVLGGLAYYTKTYGFFFFLAHFVIVSAVHWWFGDAPARAGVRRHLIVGLSAFAALVVLWVGALYAKYHVVTLGINGSYNQQIVGPDARDRPILQIGFDADPRPGNTSVWEDPADFYKVPSALECCLKPWSPLSSARNLKHQLRLVASNARITVQQLQIFSELALALIVIAVVLCIPPRDAVRRNLPLVLTVGTLALYPAGYLLVYSEERYLWPVLFLLIALSGHLLTLAFATPFLADPRRRVLLAAAVALSFVKMPIPRLLGSRDYGRNTSRFVEALRGTDLRGKRIASDEDYGASDIVAYYAGAKYIGQNPPAKWTPAELDSALKRARIDYYLVWDRMGPDVDLNRFERVKEVSVPPGNGGQTKLTILRPL